jgi:hypothetical protein
VLLNRLGQFDRVYVPENPNVFTPNKLQKLYLVEQRTLFWSEELQSFVDAGSKVTTNIRGAWVQDGRVTMLCNPSDLRVLHPNSIHRCIITTKNESVTRPKRR